MRRQIVRVISAILLIFMILGFSTPGSVKADNNRLIYTVIEGDTLDSIAQAFHTSAFRIRYINYLSDADYLYPGERLILPGFEDVQGEVIRATMPYGESLSSYFGSLRQPLVLLNRLNFITNPDQVWGGQPIYIMYTDQPMMKEVRVTSGLTSLELAVKQDVSNWAISEYNDLSGPYELIPNTSLWLPDKDAIPGVNVDPVPAMTITPTYLYQGKTEELIAAAPPAGAALSGELTMMVNDSLGESSSYTATTYPLHFFPDEDGRYTALQGIHRFTKPGMAPITLTTTYEDGSTFSLQQNLLVKSADYGLDVPLEVDPATIDPAITVPEWDLLKSVVQDAPPEKQWINGLLSPSPSPDTWISSYGRVRSYNDSDYIYFHSGIDFPGSTSTPIFAAAAGEVVFTGELDVRGGATIISHGRGVYTGYWHQSQINVNVGDHVEAGQTIGMVGASGRVTGAHLHLELIVGGVQVDPSEWLQGMY